MVERALLVVTGEESGDAMAAAVLRNLDVRAFGMGGSALLGAGLDPIAHIRAGSVIGAGAFGRLPGLLRAMRALEVAVAERRPRAALLAGFSGFNGRLGHRLRARGVRVLWYSPPQVWAWWPQRARRLARSADELAVILPFESRLWREAGAVASFAGHPSVEAARAGRYLEDRRGIVLLPGSRDSEVKHHLPAMLRAAAVAGLPATTVLAANLSPRVRTWAERQLARARVSVARAPIHSVLSRSIAAIVASGTATVDCVAAGTPPVIVYRTDALTWKIARRVVKVRSVGLPNVVLQGPVFPELLQREATPARIREALAMILDDIDHYRRACHRATTALRGAGAPSVFVANRLESWLGERSAR